MINEKPLRKAFREYALMKNEFESVNEKQKDIIDSLEALEVSLRAMNESFEKPVSRPPVEL